MHFREDFNPDLVVVPPHERGPQDYIAESANEEKFAEWQMRARAAATILEWAGAGDYSWNSLDAICEGDMEVDEDGMANDEEAEYYDDLWESVGNAISMMGVPAYAVQKFMDDEDVNHGRRIGAYVSDYLDNVMESDEDIITGYAVGASRIFEDTNIVPYDQYAMGRDDFNPVMESYKKTMRGGEVVLKKKRKKKKKMTAQERAAFKKMQKKSHTSGAKRQRKKSMKARKQRGW